MGQLEKYGLYVLCLVIFLILGVTIWGNPERPQVDRSPGAAMRATEAPAGPGKAAPPANAGGSVRPGDDGVARELESLLGPDVLRGGDRRPQEPVRNEAPKPGVDAPVVKTGGSPEAAVAVAPSPAPDTQRGTYKVKAGDSFESIARTRLGSAALRPELQRLNPDVAPNRMRVGQDLVLPSPAEIARLSKPAADPKPATAKVDGRTAIADAAAQKKVAVEVAAAERSYTIGKGDTFERIARAELGSSKRVEELRELNPAVDPTRLRIGQRIKLPKK
ncbi:MAG: LysM peptidoglycan-binding domain-containing protein [Planctomycetes bacterium]|jgi:nucleoid-associated protein YgaU|nr:LysM peptidoglycan-binding domain-containing protein [Planctomycetota bacterium]